MSLKIEQRKLSEIKPYENNPRINDEAVESVADSIRQFGWAQPIVVDKDGIIIIGHTRLKAAFKLGLDTAPVMVADLPPEKVKALRIADNQTATIARWDYELLPLELSKLQDMDYDISHLGFDEKRLEELLIKSDLPEVEDSVSEVEPSEIESVSGDAEEAVKNADQIILQFSGGKDSTVVLNWARGICEKHDTALEAVLVETGAEFPDIVSHTIRICEQLGVKLTLLYPDQNILEYYCQKKQWPDSLYRDCLHKFINEPVNKYVRNFGDKKVLVMRGGRKDQKTSNSKSDMFQDVKDGKHTIHLLNPFFGVSKDDYEKALAECEPLMWRGYKLGFDRTACWCCCFQKTSQWDALKQHYPLLWEEMRKLSLELDYKLYKGDNTRSRFYQYWKVAESPQTFCASV